MMQNDPSSLLVFPYFFEHCTLVEMTGFSGRKSIFKVMFLLKLRIALCRKLFRIPENEKIMTRWHLCFYNEAVKTTVIFSCSFCVDLLQNSELETYVFLIIVDITTNI